MTEETKINHFMFKPHQFLGSPRVVAPYKEGFVSATVQFVIRGLHIGKEKQAFLNISKYCGLEVHDAKFETVKSQNTDNTLVALAFYVSEKETNEKTEREVENYGRLFIERFVGILSFSAGIKCSVVGAQTSISDGRGKISTRLDAKSRTKVPKAEFKLADQPFMGRTPSDEIFSALFWLRRGLAERDALETYASLMVCLQNIAREIVKLNPTATKCPNCGTEVSKSDPSITKLVHELVVKKLGGSEDLFKRIWKARNAIGAHGNKTVTADVFLELTELKFDVTKLCFDGIKLAMGMLVNEGPLPHQSCFVTSALMYLD